ncbi:MAG: 16S rRNA processing protein RimM [Thermodesulfobacteria bacterium]|nr:16S rRNA processing protein RimM [Thermodesulfobacteriota bacterium]
MLVAVGKLVATHGLKGELKFAPYVFSLEVFFEVKKFYLSKDKKSFLEVENIRQGPGIGILLVKFKGVNFEEAENLVNSTLYMDLNDLPALSEEEYYFHEVIGAEVIDPSGKNWGKVKGIMPVGEYDLLLVEDKDKREFYIPLVEDYVSEIDTKEKRVLVKDISALVEAQR